MFYFDVHPPYNELFLNINIDRGELFGSFSLHSEDKLMSLKWTFHAWQFPGVLPLSSNFLSASRREARWIIFSSHRRFHHLPARPPLIVRRGAAQIAKRLIWLCARLAAAKLNYRFTNFFVSVGDGLECASWKPIRTLSRHRQVRYFRPLEHFDLEASQRARRLNLQVKNKKESQNLICTRELLPHKQCVLVIVMHIRLITCGDVTDTPQR